ncbi:hypothetical protein Tco_1092598 [Tanacetum coccineum]|uniref:Uncharacterized protein n=1 Tax=Tanacetum coccineum TaxID=301880 RepID=A0ABQ5IBM1_9ASTR
MNTLNPTRRAQEKPILKRFKPYLDAQEGNRIYNFEERNQYSPPKPVPIEYDINNPDEDLPVKKLTIWYTLKKTYVELVQAF